MQRGQWSPRGLNQVPGWGVSLPNLASAAVCVCLHTFGGCGDDAAARKPVGHAKFALVPRSPTRCGDTTFRRMNRLAAKRAVTKVTASGRDSGRMRPARANARRSGCWRIACHAFDVDDVGFDHRLRLSWRRRCIISAYQFAEMALSAGGDRGLVGLPRAGEPVGVGDPAAEHARRRTGWGCPVLAVASRGARRLALVVRFAKWWWGGGGGSSGSSGSGGSSSWAAVAVVASAAAVPAALWRRQRRASPADSHPAVTPVAPSAAEISPTRWRRTTAAAIAAAC